MKSFFRDLRHGVRLLGKSRGFAAAAVVVLALGIGPNTAIFSLVNSVLLQPLPYRDPARLVRVWHTPPQSGFPGVKTFSVSTGNYIDWDAQNHVFDKTAMYHFGSMNLIGSGKPEAVQTAQVSKDFFGVLGSQPVLGRVFTPPELEPGGPKAVVLSHALWQTRFGGDSGIVGRDIRLNDQPYRVVGVMGPRFRMPGWARAWVPLLWDAKERAVRANHNGIVIARLKKGVDVKQAQGEMNVISDRLARQYPEEDAGWGALVVPLQADMVGDVRPTLLVLLGAVAFVLLIACANVTNLVLTRTLGRRKEIAIRGALGASRGQILQQLVAETLVLSLLGGALGLLFAHAAARGMVSLLADQLPETTEVHLDLSVLAFTFAISLLTGVLAGIAPAWRLSGANVAGFLKQGMGRTDADAGGNRARGLLVTAEVALSLVLLIGAGLLIRSIWLLQRVDPGFDPHGVFRMALQLPGTKYSDPAQQAAFFDQVIARMRALPGVESAGAASNLPTTGESNWPISVEGRPLVSIAQQPNVVATTVSGDYFQALRIGLLRGRRFTAADRADAPGVVVINEAMAKLFWPGESPIGKRLTASFFPEKVREVVGVVRNVKQHGLDVAAGVPILYAPAVQIPQRGMEIVVRSKSGGIAAAALAAVHAVDPDEPVLEMGTMDDILADSLGQRRNGMRLLAAFAGLALLLASVGIYSVVSYSVRRRSQEIGVRMALGARRSDVLALILGQGMRPTLLGVAIGIAAALALGRALSGLVYGVSASDPATIAAVAGGLVLLSLFACLIPAARAARIDPLRALRDE